VMVLIHLARAVAGSSYAMTRWLRLCQEWLGHKVHIRLQYVEAELGARISALMLVWDRDWITPRIQLLLSSDKLDLAPFRVFHAALSLADLGQQLVDEEAVNNIELALLDRVNRCFHWSEVLDWLVAEAEAFLVDVFDEGDLVFEVRIVRTGTWLVLSHLDLSFMKYVVVLADVAVPDDLLILFVSDFLELRCQFQDVFEVEVTHEWVFVQYL
jgi:hypothetical protein